MFAEWTPIAKMMKYETFETQVESSQVIVGNVFIGVALMIMAACITILFYWAYNKEKHLFITLLCGLMFLYTVKVIILVASMRDKINKNVFRLYIGSTAFMSLLSLFLLIFFAVKTSKRLNASSSPVAPYYNPAPIARDDAYNAA
jgi:vacuolar-type H+-ATPase subunit I/STV1